MSNEHVSSKKSMHLVAISSISAVNYLFTRCFPCSQNIEHWALASGEAIDDVCRQSPQQQRRPQYTPQLRRREKLTFIETSITDMVRACCCCSHRYLCYHCPCQQRVELDIKADEASFHCLYSLRFDSLLLRATQPRVAWE